MKTNLSTRKVLGCTRLWSCSPTKDRSSLHLPTRIRLEAFAQRQDVQVGLWLVQNNAWCPTRTRKSQEPMAKCGCTFGSFASTLWNEGNELLYGKLFNWKSQKMGAYFSIRKLFEKFWGRPGKIEDPRPSLTRPPGLGFLTGETGDVLHPIFQEKYPKLTFLTKNLKFLLRIPALKWQFSTKNRACGDVFPKMSRILKWKKWDDISKVPRSTRPRVFEKSSLLEIVF